MIELLKHRKFNCTLSNEKVFKNYNVLKFPCKIHNELKYDFLRIDLNDPIDTFSTLPLLVHINLVD